jgi:SpoVK/Ycf46/Vps4 family AAA+-type ATPase
VLNSFLQMIDQDESNSVIIAATNHPEILDYALFRRFDDVIEYGLPNHEQIAAMLKSRLVGFKSRKLTWRKIAEEAAGLSYAEISRAADEAIKNAIIHEHASIAEGDLIRTLTERKLMRHKLTDNNEKGRLISHAGSTPTK